MSHFRDCTCCGPDLSTCERIYHTRRGKVHYLKAPNDLLTLPVPPARQTTAFYEPLPSTWNPHPYDSTLFLGPFTGNPVPNYYNVNPNYFGTTKVDFQPLTRVDYSHPNLFSGFDVRLSDAYQNPIGVGMFNGGASGISPPGCNRFSINDFSEGFDTATIGEGSDQHPDSIDITFSKVPVDIDVNNSPLMLNDTKDVQATVVHYYSAASGPGVFSLLDADPAWFGVVPFPHQNPNAVNLNREGFSLNGVEQGHGTFVTGQTLRATRSWAHQFSFDNGTIGHSVRLNGNEGNSRYHTLSIDSVETIDITPMECIPKVLTNGAGGAVGHFAAAGPYSTHFRTDVSRAAYDNDPAFYDNRYLGKPNYGLQLGEMGASQGARGQTPQVLCDVTLRFNFLTDRNFVTGDNPFTVNATQRVAPDTLKYSYFYDNDPEAGWRDSANEASLILTAQQLNQNAISRKHGVRHASTNNSRMTGGPIYGFTASFPSDLKTSHSYGAASVNYERTG